jgi:hypothetical protein
VKVAVPPTTANFAAGDLQVGAIYAADGTLERPLLVADAARAFNDALIKGLADAGLTPVARDSNPADGKPPQDSDFILTSELQQIEVNQRFGASETVHGQYFTMNAVVRVKYEMKNRDGAVVYSDVISGVENEPPNPVGGEVFLPLETEPAESLSVALSRAVGLLMIQPKFRGELRMRPVEASAASSQTPRAIPSPNH